MKAHIIKDGEYKGMRFTKGLVYSVSDPTLAELIGMGIALDNRPKVTVDPKEVKAPKAPKAKKVTKEKAQMVSIPAAKVTVPGLTTSKETKEEKFQNPTEE
jgi:hypothetical protein